MKTVQKTKMMILMLLSVFLLMGNETISGATLTVTSPNGGESLVAGAATQVTWTSDVTGNVRITLLKSDLQIMVIAAGTPNDGTQTWNIPATIFSGNDFKVKIASCLDPTVFDASDDIFTITGNSSGTIAVVSPNGGETFTAGTLNNITWTSDVTGNVRISLLKAGAHYAMISFSTPNDGVFEWLIPARLAAGNEYSVKIASVTFPALFDVSDAAFSITPGGGTFVTVLSPNGGETFDVGATMPITWTSDVTGYLRISLQKGGVDLMLISAKTVNDGSFDWLIPATVPTGTDYSVKICYCLNTVVTDVSDAPFTINGTGGSTIAVISPNGGETLTAGTTNAITWSSDITGNVRITLLKAGLHYALISSSTPNDGSYDWTIPSRLAAGAEYSIKIASAATPLLFDVSDAYFSVVAGGGTFVTVIAPNGGETFVAAAVCPVTWTSDVTGFLRLSLQKAGVDYMLISGHTLNDGAFDWLIPETLVPGDDYTVKISYCFNPVVSDVSDAAFTIAATDAGDPKSNLKTSTIESKDYAPVVSLYPNPVSEKLNISANGNINHVWVLNSLGQTVFETSVNASDFQLDVNEFNPDVYFVRVETEGTVTTHKVFVK